MFVVPFPYTIQTVGGFTENRLVCAILNENVFCASHGFCVLATSELIADKFRLTSLRRNLVISESHQNLQSFPLRHPNGWTVWKKPKK
jgi:hypothetical protein